MTEAEAPIERNSVRWAEHHGWVVRKVAWLGRRGAADRVFFGFGRCVWIEFKRPGKTPVGQQAKELQRIREAYPDVHVADSVRDVCRVLKIPEPDWA